MLYSSGTTGRPKGIRRPLSGQPFGTDATLAPMLGGMMGFEEGDVYLSPAPLYHAAPLVWSMTAQRLGGTVVVMERFDPERCLDADRRAPGDPRPVRPHHVRAPAQARASGAGGATTSPACESVVHAAAPCAPEVKRRMIEWWGPIIHEYYSGTEGGGMTWVRSEEWLAHPGSVGAPVVGRSTFATTTATSCRRRGRGRVVRGRGNTFEYNNDPEKTKQTFNERGWSTLWDVGHLDEDGYLYLTDRKLFMIVSGGVNIYPQEIEDVLVLHPAVADVAVFGVPDAEMGEQVKAVVQPAAPASAGPRVGRGDHRVLPGASLPLQVPEFGRLHRCHAPGGERQALQEAVARRLLGQPHPELPDLSRRRSRRRRTRTAAGRPRRRRSAQSVMPTVATNGPTSRLPTATVPPKPMIHSAMTRPRTASSSRACSVVFSAVMKAK